MRDPRVVNKCIRDKRAMMAIRYEDGPQLGTLAGVRHRARKPGVAAAERVPSAITVPYLR